MTITVELLLRRGSFDGCVGRSGGNAPLPLATRLLSPPPAEMC
jgi:hypothetical protein